MTSLDSMKEGGSAGEPSVVQYQHHGNGIFSIRINEGGSGNTLSLRLIDALMRAIETLRQDDSVKVLILSGTADAFLRGEREHYNEAVERKLYEAIAAFPCPVIAAARGDASGAGFLAAALCDVMVCSQAARYQFSGQENGYFPSAAEEALFAERFGRIRATHFLYHGAAFTGKQLQDKGWNCPILPAEQVEEHAHALAQNLARKSHVGLRLLKQHLSRDILALAKALPPVAALAMVERDFLVSPAMAIAAPGKYVQLEPQDGNVLLLRIREVKRKHKAKDVVAELSLAVGEVDKHAAGNSAPYRAIVIASDVAGGFLAKEEGDLPADVAASLAASVLRSSIPVIAVLGPQVSAGAWLISQSCDATIYLEDGQYSGSGLLHSEESAELANALFGSRFGHIAASDILLKRQTYSGVQLQQQFGPLPVFRADEALSKALQLARSWACLPPDTAKSWKQERSRAVLDLIAGLPRPADPPMDEPVSVESGPVALKSAVISATAHPGGIVMVKMADREARNMFSEQFIEGMREVFAHIDATPGYKVVVLSGYDNYFASGGTKEALVAIQEGKVRFTDDVTYRLALDCKIPVIAAMQGHGIGGGLSLGLFADVIVLSEESKFFSPYMGYGFTPGAGATLIVPHRMGHDLAREALLSAQEYAGSELKARGLPYPVYPRKQVLDAALDLAKQIAQHPRASLIHLKRQSNRVVNEKLAENTRLELAMHEQTFVGKQDTLKQIHSVFDPMNSHTQTAADPNLGLAADPGSDEAAPARVASLPDIIASLKTLLAEELHMGEQDIDDDMQFVDLGLDSITGVTWVRKINEKYKTEIAAIKVYSYPTLAQLGEHVRQELESAGDEVAAPSVAAPSVAAPSVAAPSVAAPSPAAPSRRADPQPATSEVDAPARPAPKAGKRLLAPTAEVSAVPAPADIVASLRMLLAEELHMGEQDIDDDAQFVDLGLDSITGVTWVRKINEKYKTEIAAIKVYSYPTLAQLGAHVRQELESAGGQAALPSPAAPSRHADPVPAESRANAAAPAAGKRLLAPAAAAVPAVPAHADIVASLKTLLAEELHMGEQEIDDDAQFVDLGLDSITGVTWVRKINEKYKTEIAAIKVYSYPTLTQLGAHVRQELESAGGESHSPSPHADPQPAASSATTPSHPASSAGKRLLAPAAAVPVAPGRVEIVASLKRLLAAELHMGENEIDEDAQFIDLGLDSITGVTWIRKVNEQYKTEIAAIKVYSYPTLNQMADHIVEEIGAVPDTPAADTAPAAAEAVRPQPAAAQPGRAGKSRPKLVSWRDQKPSRMDDQRAVQAPAAAPAPAPAPVAAQAPVGPIAVIGIAGQFPQARSVEEFWRNIAEGRNCISEVPSERWSNDTYYRPGEPVPGKTNSRWMGALNDYDKFDPLFFNISPGEAESMDPQQRLFLEACWHSIENAGYNPRALSGSKCGVFAGCGSGDYHLLSDELRVSAQGFTGGAPSILAGRIAYFLNLQGPCVSIDTACSSSLVAIASACESLNAGTSDLVLAGGVAVMSGPEMHIKTAQAGMLAQDGRCYTFDQRANGFVAGEAVGVVVLKRLADAQRDRDPIQGLIQGWGINQDGKTNGITAPNPESQARLEQDVYDRFQIDPAEIQLIEAHGTATKLGDPIEVDALKSAFKKYTRNKEYCALGSVKSNIGHCLQAAGIASFIKLMLALKHEQLPPTINFEQINEHIDLRNSPFYVNTRLREWPLGGARWRQAAVSSFGFSGTNAHLVVRQYQPRPDAILPVSVIRDGSRIAVPLSAKTPEQLKQVAQRLLDFVRRDGAAPDLLELAYTLQVGREAMDERLGFLVSSIGELAQKLQAYVDGKTGDFYQGQVKRHREGLSLVSQDEEVRETLVATWIGQKKLSKLVDWWTKGLAFDWNKLYGEAKPARIALPVYPFARERYWFEAQPARQERGAQAAQPNLHPLVHRNTSDLYQHSYGATFTGDEFFLADHCIRNDAGIVPLLPGVAYLEMARAALAQALPDLGEHGALELRDVVWLQPVIVTAERQVSIALSTDDAEPVEHIDFSIYSQDNDAEIVHCEGYAVRSPAVAPVRMDLAALTARMHGKAPEPSMLYPMFAQMGLHYGQAHQGIAALHIGDRELLAELRLGAPVAHTLDGFVLHPGMADSALQATAGLIFDLSSLPGRPAVPFALESVRIFSPCTTAMHVWVRYASGSQAGDAVVKLDLDLCDEHGNVCVQMRGFAARIMESGSGSGPGAGGQAEGRGRQGKEDVPFDEDFYQGLIDGLLGDEVSIDDAAELG